MTGMLIKDVGRLFPGQGVSGTGKGAAGSGGFQKVWNGQMSKDTSDSTAGNGDAQDKVSVQPKDNAAREQVQSDSGRKAEEVQKNVSEETDAAKAVSEEQDVQETRVQTDQEQVEAMEVLGSAAVRVMEQLAETFDVSMEELQAVMEDLGMNPVQLLDAAALKELLLQLGGVQDSYALLTDGALYDKYQWMMGQQREVLQESAAELGMDQEALQELLKDGFETMQAAQKGGDAELFPGRTEEQEDGLTALDELHSDTTADIVREEQTAPKQNGETQERDGKPAQNREQGTFFIQDFRAEQFRPGAEQVQEAVPESAWNSETRQIMDQILDYMKLNLNADSTSLEMQLHPANLGTLQVQIASKGGIVTANFITQNESVKAALESQMVQLREQFEEQGVKVEAIEVTVQTHQFEQNLEQGRGRSQQEEGRRNRSRRIGQGIAVAAEDPSADEAMPQDSIAAGGSTVSYTA